VVYHYSVYGLSLKSGLAIDGLAPARPLVAPLNGDRLEVSEATPEPKGAVLDWPKLIYSSHPHDHANATFSVYLSDGGQFFQLCYQDGARFVVDESTRRIWVDGSPELRPTDLAIYLVGPVMGFVLRRRGVLTLHASCFSLAGHAFGLCGRPGAGKSTTAAALALRGVPIICEDITALYERDAGFQAAPGYPRVNLWPEAAAMLFPGSIELPKITPNWEKRYLALDGHQANFEPHPRPLAALYILDERNHETRMPVIDDLSPREASLHLVENTYMNYLLDKRQRAVEFDAIARLVSTTTVKRVVPSNDPGKILALCEALEHDAALIAESSNRTAASAPLP
jgi:hypothetical protein